MQTKGLGALAFIPHPTHPAAAVSYGAAAASLS